MYVPPSQVLYRCEPEVRKIQQLKKVDWESCVLRNVIAGSMRLGSSLSAGMETDERLQG